MTQSKADLILHPIRMRIIQTLITGGNRTTQQLAEQLANVPQATMYRHLNTLLKAGLLEVVEERKNRGTVEKVYTLARGGAELSVGDLTASSSEEHMELFLKFVASLIGEFGAYTGQEHYHLVEDGVSFRQLQLNLNDDEYLEMLREIRERMQKHAGNEPGNGRRMRMISTIVIPEVSNDYQRNIKGDKNDE
jgi:DNA-binding transcriptional ArsR family regulator